MLTWIILLNIYRHKHIVYMRKIGSYKNKNNRLMAAIKNGRKIKDY